MPHSAKTRPTPHIRPYPYQLLDRHPADASELYSGLERLGLWGYHDARGGLGGRVAGVFLWGGLEIYRMQAVREINNIGYGGKMEESRSITGMLKVNKIRATFGERSACPFCLLGGGATLLDRFVSFRYIQRGALRDLSHIPPAVIHNWLRGTNL